MVNLDTKQVYNTYLKTLAKKQNRGFKYRKSMDGVDNEKLNYCNKIVSFLKQHPHIDIDTFFEAPLQLNEEFVPTLKFYTTYTAIKQYTLWIKKRQHLPPDSDYHIKSIKDSFKTVLLYCRDNNLKWDEYIESDSIVPHWTKHLKDQTVNMYMLMGYKDFKQKIDNLEEDIKELYVQDIADNYITYKAAFQKSKHAKSLVKNGFELLRKYLN